MLLPRKWRNLALGMITVTILCNLLVLKQMPDSSSRTIRAVTRTEEEHGDAAQTRGSTSRKLGSTKGTSFSGSTGVLKRWILSGDAHSKQRANSTAEESDQQRAENGELSSEGSLEHETSEQLYNSHPRFGQQNLAARSLGKQAAKEPTHAQSAQQLEASEQPGDIASSLVSNASTARPQNLVQLAEAFRQQQVVQSPEHEPCPCIYACGKALIACNLAILHLTRTILSEYLIVLRTTQDGWHLLVQCILNGAATSSS